MGVTPQRKTIFILKNYFLSGDAQPCMFVCAKRARAIFGYSTPGKDSFVPLFLSGKHWKYWDKSPFYLREPSLDFLDVILNPPGGISPVRDLSKYLRSSLSRSLRVFEMRKWCVRHGEREEGSMPCVCPFLLSRDKERGHPVDFSLPLCSAGSHVVKKLPHHAEQHGSQQERNFFFFYASE